MHRLRDFEVIHNLTKDDKSLSGILYKLSKYIATELSMMVYNIYMLHTVGGPPQTMHAICAV